MSMNWIRPRTPRAFQRRGSGVAGWPESMLIDGPLLTGCAKPFYTVPTYEATVIRQSDNVGRHPARCARIGPGRPCRLTADRIVTLLLELGPRGQAFPVPVDGHREGADAGGDV